MSHLLQSRAMSRWHPRLANAREWRTDIGPMSRPATKAVPSRRIDQSDHCRFTWLRSGVLAVERDQLLPARDCDESSQQPGHVKRASRGPAKAEKPISPALHAPIDYGFRIVFLSMPALQDLSGAARVAVAVWFIVQERLDAFHRSEIRGTPCNPIRDAWPDGDARAAHAGRSGGRPRGADHELLRNKRQPDLGTVGFTWDRRLSDL